MITPWWQPTHRRGGYRADGRGSARWSRARGSPSMAAPGRDLPGTCTSSAVLRQRKEPPRGAALRLIGGVSRSARHLAGLEAPGADVDTLRRPVDGRAHPLDIRVEATLRNLARPRPVVAEARPLGADVTDGSHRELLGLLDSRELRVPETVRATAQEYPTPLPRRQSRAACPSLALSLTVLARSGRGFDCPSTRWPPSIWRRCCGSPSWHCPRSARRVRRSTRSTSTRSRTATPERTCTSPSRPLETRCSTRSGPDPTTCPTCRSKGTWGPPWSRSLAAPCSAPAATPG